MKVKIQKKSIIMIGGGIQEILAVTKIQSIGYNVIVIDRNQQAPCLKIADVRVILDGKDVQAIISWILAYSKKYNISGVFTMTSLAPTVALVAKATGLPSLPVNITMECDNKLLMKRRFKELNIPSAVSYEVSSPDEAINIINNSLNKTYCLKVVDGFGGKGIKFIKTLDDVADSFELFKKFSSFPVFLLEEVIHGKFIDVQGVFYDDKFYKAGTADSYFSNELSEYMDFNPVEIFNVSPSQQADEVLNEAYNLLEQTARKMQMTWGPVSADLILTGEGLKIIELGPRLHGPNGTLRIFPASTGINPLEFMAQCVAGDVPDTSLLNPTMNKVALCYVFVSSKKHIEKVEFTTDPENLPGLFDWNIYHGKHTAIERSAITLSGLAGIFVTENSYDEAVVSLNIVKKSFIID
jgi:biotin carboxylase